MYKRIRTGLVSTALVAGSFIGAGVVSAQVDDTTPTGTSTEQPADETPADEVPADETPTDEVPADETGQADRAERRAERAERRAERAERRAEHAQATADLLGIDVDELTAAFQEGQTLAQLAEANGVDVQTIIDANVASHTERIEAAVETGRLTDAEATEKLAELEERVTTRVNEGRQDRGERGGRRGHDHVDAEATVVEDGS